MPLMYIRGWECLCVFNNSMKNGLDVAKTVLWTSICWPSSQARVTSVNSLSFLNALNESDVFLKVVPLKTELFWRAHHLNKAIIAFEAAYVHVPAMRMHSVHRMQTYSWRAPSKYHRPLIPILAESCHGISILAPHTLAWNTFRPPHKPLGKMKLEIAGNSWSFFCARWWRCKRPPQSCLVMVALSVMVGSTVVKITKPAQCCGNNDQYS